LKLDEILSVVKMDLKKVIKMIKSGEIQDSKTICAIMTYVSKNKL
jgi:ADP-ribose pyrophosphatase